MNDDEKRFLEQIQKENESAHAETRRHVQDLATNMERMQTQNDAEHSETRRQFAGLAQRFDETSRLMRQHFDVVAEDIAKKTHAEIQLLAESLAHVDHKVDVNSAKIDQLAADNEVFKAAFANVDRRLRVVEDIVLPQKPS
jgi:hypothetical protein